ncbi:MAG: DNA-processing protein DprA [Dysgonamonadaceae bacterium]|jgi:DNA processing protein|nr:DNA-processing protein DprA [Dysgonamonadaceae bacterium]
MSGQNLLYQIGITLVKGIGNITAKQIIDHLDDVSLVFTEQKRLLERVPGLSRRIIAEIRRPEVLKRAEQEVRFIEKNKIMPLFITSPAYPKRLRECADSPVMLYYRGNADLNAAKVISVVGTKNASAYGRDMTEQLVRGVKEKFPDTLVISGLAYGIDICAHRAALQENVATVGVLAHGLDRIYPHVHRSTAVEMLNKGGLLTDFMSETNPDRQNFVKRNRIIAGIADCTIVVESAEKSGALITAGIADSYNRDLFAYPGKAEDRYSAGCNSLIKYRKAALVTSAQDVFREMNWDAETQSAARPAVQRSLFTDLNTEEKTVFDLLSKAKNLQMNSLAIELNWPVGQLSGVLFELEMKGIIRCKPGGVYGLV